jgi:hypothetical protein
LVDSGAKTAELKAGGFSLPNMVARSTIVEKVGIKFLASRGLSYRSIVAQTIRCIVLNLLETKIFSYVTTIKSI